MRRFGLNTTTSPYLVGCALMTNRCGSGPRRYFMKLLPNFDIIREMKYELKVAGQHGETQGQET